MSALVLAGHVGHTEQHDNFTVCKYCADFAELQAFAVKLGVNRD